MESEAERKLEDLVGLGVLSMNYPLSRMPCQSGEPAWDVALLFPRQGYWTEADYLALDTNQLVELSAGCLEVLSMPTPFHQRIVSFLVQILDAYVTAHAAGMVLFAPLPVRLMPGKYREPDIVFFRPGRIHDMHQQPHGADLAMEVVSEGAENRERDLVTKPQEYAAAGIAEYWIVDPQEQRITVLKLDGSTYRVHGEFGPGTTATSVLLPGFAVAVDAVFAAGLSAHPPTVQG
jgi:Uma2 family endonuclease